MTHTSVSTRLPGCPGARIATLSEGENHVLELMASGLTNRCIAQQLWISPKTVEARIASIFRKLRLHNDVDENRRVMAVLAYLRHQDRLTTASVQLVS